jgi:hypothetical protein
MIAHRCSGYIVALATVNLFGMSRSEFISQIHDMITVGEIYEKAAGGQIIFT